MRNTWCRVGDDIYIVLRRRYDDPMVAVIDISDFNLVDSNPGRWHLKWNKTAKGWYVMSNDDCGFIRCYLHRFIMGITNPHIPVDHKDNDGLNNRRINLIESDAQRNGFNRKGATTRSSSGYRNVMWNSRKQRYEVHFVYRGQYHWVGQFTDPVVADAAAKEARARFM